MASDPNTPGASPPDPRMAAIRAKSQGLQSAPPAPPSKPLQIFLATALVITGAAYVAGEWTDPATHQNVDRRLPQLRHLVESQSVYLSETKLGQIAESKNLYDQAVTHYRRALQGKNNAEGHLHLGNALLKQGNPDIAFAQFREALHQDPGSVEIYEAWGRALTLQGRTDEAMALYKQALARNSNFGQIHYQMALILAADHNNNHEAATHFAKATKFGVDNAEFWTSYGNFLNEQRNFAEAATALHKAVAADPASSVAQFQLAAAQDHLGQYGDAIGHYESALSLTPDDPPTLNNLALVYVNATNSEVRSPQMAILLATRACSATTDQNAHFMDTLARSYAANGDFFQAIAWEDKAIHRATQLLDKDLLGELNSRYNLFRQHRTQ